MAAASTLESVPDDFDQSYLRQSFSVNTIKKACKFSQEYFFFDIKLNLNPNTSVLEIFGRCFPSKRRSKDPHQLSVSLDLQKKAPESTPFCSCEIG